MAVLKRNKGPQMEEALRQYFLQSGYFVVRGAKFSYDNYDITDVDLWLYSRPSSFVRERANVDLKNKRTPQAIERIFWTKGLQLVLGLEQSIVATSDKRLSVKTFGEKHDVIVLDGNFLKKLERKYDGESKRITEEKLYHAINSISDNKLSKEWKSKFESSKSIMITTLSYDGGNALLEHCRYFSEQVLFVDLHKELACRILYLLIAYFCICTDFVLRQLTFEERSNKQRMLTEGFRHGSHGEKGTDRLVETAESLLETYLPDGRALGKRLRENVSREFGSIRADILGEYFAKAENAQMLFLTAIDFDRVAYATDFTPPENINTKMKTLLGLILDFSEIERRRIFERFAIGSHTIANLFD